MNLFRLSMGNVGDVNVQLFVTEIVFERRSRATEASD